MKKIFTLYLMLISVSFTALSAQTLKSMEFHNQEITDILLVLAQVSGTSIIPDETVTGTASFYFAESSFEDALSLFLSTYKLFYVKDGSVIRVSRIKTAYNPETGLASVKAYDTAVESLVRSLSATIQKTILYDTLPKMTMSIDIDSLPVPAVLEIFTKRLTDYQIESTESYYYIKKTQTGAAQNPAKHQNTGVKRSADSYTLTLDSGRLIETLVSLFSAAEKEYSFLIQSDTQLTNLYFAEKDFETMLRLILEQGNADYIEKNGIYYILELQKKDVVKKLKTTEIIALTWIQAQDIPTLLPAELASNSVLKIDKTNNLVILSGTPEEITPIRQFINQIDRQLNGLQYQRIEIKYLNAKDVLTLIPAKIVQTPPVQIPGTNALLATGTQETLQTLTAFINGIDSKRAGIPIRLKYIQAEELLKNLPPSLSKETLTDSGYPNLLFYTGTEENRQLFLHELSLIDRPKPQIRYQMLIIQYVKGKSSTTKPSINIAPTSNPSNFAFTGDLTNILSLSFDIIAKFGYQFAAKLNAQLTENLANVFTDTTLTALSGQEIKFQNTDTYRYIEYEIDEDTGKTKKTGVTQQITSGLIVSLNGWISGDDMITMTVNATVSKQNGDTSSGSSNTSLTTLPSTSERVVTTQVRTPSGQPVVISGLIKEDTSVTEQKIPVLGSIPLLGRLFKHTVKSKEKTEIVIYLVPHLIREAEQNGDDSLRLERYYRTFIGKTAHATL